MKIERSEEVQSQLQEAFALRTKLINQLTKALVLGGNKTKGKKNPPKNPLIQTLELSAEGFVPVLTAVKINDLDRTSSMLAGPFFTSEEYVIPVTSTGMLMPVVQLNLKEISQLSKVDLGDGLLQLWCDPDWSNANRGLVFVVPRDVVEHQTLTPFVYKLHPDANESPLPEDLVFYPSDDEVKVITGYKSVGLQCQTNYLNLFAEDIPDEVRESVEKDIQRFQDLTDFNSDLHVFGSFYPIQYSAVDVGWNCLISFPTWGSCGNAQVFFITLGSDMAFRFDESLR